MADIQMTAPSTSSMSSSEPSPSQLDRFEEDNYVIRYLGHGSGAVVYATIPKQIADPIVSGYLAGTRTKDLTYRQLRTNLQAAKICKEDEGSFQQEINTLMDLRLRPHITQIIDADILNGWITMELLSGGSLRDFEDAHMDSDPAPYTMPPSFGWHVIGEAAEAFLELHFGIVKNILTPGTSRYVHYDTHGGNLMFRYPGAYEDYPDFVLGDLGGARPLDSQEESSYNYQLYDHQVNDWHDAVAQLEILIKAIGNAELTETWKQLALFQFKREHTSLHNAPFQEYLIEVRDEARRMRALTYEELPPEIASNPITERITDENLEAFEAEQRLQYQSASSSA